MAKKPKRTNPRSRSGKSNIRVNKRTSRGKSAARVGRKRRRVTAKHARLDISIHPTPVIERAGQLSKMAVAKKLRRAIL